MTVARTTNPKPAPRKPVPKTVAESPESAIPPPTEAKAVAPPTPAKKRLRAAVGGVIGAAVVGALATALITSERVDGFFNWVGAGFASPAPTSETTELATKTVSSVDKVFTLDVPEDWSVGLSTFDVFDEDYLNVGSGIFTGEDLNAGVDFDKSGAYLGASTYAAEKLGLVGASRSKISEWADDFADEFDWTIDGCTLTNQKVPERDGWIVEGRIWKDCASNGGMRLIEIFAVPEGGEFLVCMQINLLESDPDEVTETLVESLAILESRLPPGFHGESVLP